MNRLDLLPDELQNKIFTYVYQNVLKEINQKILCCCCKKIFDQYNKNNVCTKCNSYLCQECFKKTNNYFRGWQSNLGICIVCRQLKFIN